MPQDGLVFDLPAGENAGGDCPLLIREIPYRDPAAAFAPWSGQPFATLLHSAEEAGGRGRWSIVAVDAGPRRRPGRRRNRRRFRSRP